jgi:hypothetical protein
VFAHTGHPVQPFGRPCTNSCCRLQVFNPSTVDREHGSWSAIGAQPSCLNLLVCVFTAVLGTACRQMLHRLQNQQLLQSIDRLHTSHCWAGRLVCHTTSCHFFAELTLFGPLPCRTICLSSQPCGPHIAGAPRCDPNCALCTGRCSGAYVAARTCM